MTNWITFHWTFLTIPIVGALIGWFTNWLAVVMMFKPLDFVGVGLLGWQGIIPANAGKMAHTLIDNSLSKIVSQEELLSRIDIDQLTDAMCERLEPHVETIIDDVIESITLRGLGATGFVWNVAPQWLRAKVYTQVRNKLPTIIDHFLVDARGKASELLDINELIAERLTVEKKLLVELFQEACDKEFLFIERSGFYFGFPMGIPVMFIWGAWPVWWVLPLFGALVGYATNWLALYMVFKPLKPTRIGPFTFHGIFLKRQAKVAAAYGRFFAEHLITAEVLTTEVLRSEKSIQRIQELIQREVALTLDDVGMQFKPLAVLSMGIKQYRSVIVFVSERTFKLLQPLDKELLGGIDRALQIESTLSSRLAALPAEDFYELLHPVVEEDEWKLIAIGGVLGALAGALQWWLM